MILFFFKLYDGDSAGKHNFNGFRINELNTLTRGVQRDECKEYLLEFCVPYSSRKCLSWWLGFEAAWKYKNCNVENIIFRFLIRIRTVTSQTNVIVWATTIGHAVPSLPFHAILAISHTCNNRRQWVCVLRLAARRWSIRQSGKTEWQQKLYSI